MEAGLTDIEVTSIDISTDFADFDDYWTPLLGGQEPAPSYLMSLIPDRRQVLADLLRERLPVQADGSILLTARAWAIRGRQSSRGE